jgi:hypothetical protein
MRAIIEPATVEKEDEKGGILPIAFPNIPNVFLYVNEKPEDSQRVLNHQLVGDVCRHTALHCSFSTLMLLASFSP